MKINFLFEKHYALVKRNRIKRVIEKIFIDYKKKLSSLNIILCSDEFLLSINQKYLKHDYYTDIITFDLSNDDNIIAEMYISLDRVKENAQSRCLDFPMELIRIIIHGTLHLAGLKDKTYLDKVEMTTNENKYLKFM